MTPTQDHWTHLTQDHWTDEQRISQLALELANVAQGTQNAPGVYLSTFELLPVQNAAWRAVARHVLGMDEA